MTNNAFTQHFTRPAATERAIESVSCNPLNIMADDGATVVHVWGANNISGGYEDNYIAIGGAHTQEEVDAMYQPTGYSAAVVSVHYREGETCEDATRRAATHV